MTTDQPLDWGLIFFRLHKYCNLNKWEIYGYTLPQVAELMKQTDLHIQFEVETRMTPLSVFGGVSTGSDDGSMERDSGEYRIATEDDINLLARVLGGG